MKLSFKLMVIVVLSCVFASAQTQTPAAAQHFDKGGLAFDYPNGWTMKDMSSEDAQEFGFSNNAADIQMRMFVHKGKVPADKLPAAKEAFIDPYVSQVEKQFVQMGATPTKSTDTSEIGGIKADGVLLSASLGGEPGAAKIYWAIVGQRVVVLTLFGPDRDIKKFAPAWDLLRSTIKIEEQKPAAAPTPKRSP